MRIVALNEGEAEGEPLLLTEPLSFWGGLDLATGRIIDAHHPQAGQNITGRILMMPASRGSSSGSAALAESLRLGAGPAAILMKRRDGIVIVGAMVAAELYEVLCPVALIEERDWLNLAAASRLKVFADKALARIERVG